MDGKQRYKQYLASEDWKLKKAQVYARRSLCSVCGDSRVLDVHHLKYRRWVDVKQRDLKILCRRCHTITHDLLNRGVIAYASDRSHLRWAETKPAVLAEIRRLGQRTYWPPKHDAARDMRGEVINAAACPECGAEIGEQCKSARVGSPPRLRNHLERIQAAENVRKGIPA